MDSSNTTFARLAPAPPRATIEDCPTEILLEILRNVRDDGTVSKSSTRKDYYNLCLVKPFHAVATELLYYNVNNYFGSASTLTANLLLRTLLRRPGLGHLIRKFRMEALSPEHRTPISEVSKMLVTTGIMAVGLSSRDQSHWLSLLNNSDVLHDICRALILMRCPNIISFKGSYSCDITPFLEFDGNHIDNTVFSAAPFHSSQYPNALEAPSFVHLKKIDLDDFVTTTDLVALFRLPALEHLAVTELEVDQPNLPDRFEFDTGMSNIKALRFAYGYIHPQVLASMVTSCRALTSFSYTCCSDKSIYNPSLDVDLSVVVSALLVFAPILQLLELAGIESDYNNQQRYTIVSQMHYFTALQVLRLDASLFLPNSGPWPRLSSLLPGTIKHLQICNVEEDVYEALTSPTGMLSDLLTAHDPAFTLLEKWDTVLSWSFERSESWKTRTSNKEGLRRFLSARGIKFEVGGERSFTSDLFGLYCG
jgi:hypothetical protein